MTYEEEEKLKDTLHYLSHATHYGLTEEQIDELVGYINELNEKYNLQLTYQLQDN